ncbi:hypothetical protein V1520DRAFT_342313 [Lipomyces starkeyi]
MVALSPENWKVKVTEVGIPGGLADQLIKWFSESDGKPATIYSSDRFSDKPSQSFEEWLKLNKKDFLGF